MQKPTLVLFIAIIVSFTALTAGAYFLVGPQNNGSNQKSKPAVDVPLKPTIPTAENTPNNSNLQVQGANTTPSNKPQILTPDKFSEFEQYKSSQTILYQDLQVGSGAVSEAGDSIDVVYKGWLTDGTLFDQSRTNEQNQLVTFNFKIGAGQVIPGWDQGFEGMKEGGKRRLIIPSQLGYGAEGQGTIPANAMLVFDVELIRVQKNQTPVGP